MDRKCHFSLPHVVLIDDVLRQQHWRLENLSGEFILLFFSVFCGFVE